MKDTIWTKTVGRLFGGEIRRQVRAGLAAESDATFLLGTTTGGSERDRLSPNRQEVLEQALEAWRVNPLARRLVELTTQYVVGGGISIHCKHTATARFLEAFWNHPLNRMAVRVFEWCDELSRSGNLFVLLTTDAAGMSYLRAVPAADVAEIHSRVNDVEQAQAFVPRASLEQLQPAPWAAYNPRKDAPGADGSFSPVILPLRRQSTGGRSPGASQTSPRCCPGWDDIPPGRGPHFRSELFPQCLPVCGPRQIRHPWRKGCPPQPRAERQPTHTRLDPGHRRKRELGSGLAQTRVGRPTQTGSR